MPARQPQSRGYQRDELDLAATQEHSPGARDAVAPCEVCGMQTSLCCSGCEAAFYCSDECQQKHWRQHRRVCARQQQLGGPMQSPRGGSKPQLPNQEIITPHKPNELFANHASITQTRERRLQLRASAVMALRDGRYKDALLFAAEAFEVAQQVAAAASHEDASAQEASATLVESLILCRSAIMEGNNSLGLSVMQRLLELTDTLAGTGNTAAIFEPDVAASLLCSVAELCHLYGHKDNAEDYAHAFLAMSRVAHGEGSPAVGDAHSLLTGLFSKWGRHSEALLHANMVLQIRQRHSNRGADKAVADANWNIGILKFQLGQHQGALESLKAARDIQCRISGESVRTSDIDVAIGTLHRIMGSYRTAVRVFHLALRARQRTYGFAHPETRRVAALLDATEIQLHSETDLGAAGG
eukprot:TRINITY_DN41317_c0_g1_i1.p1 TRINITY_DN41317_c0_g1~~TRINITY_DN41317_c0_g1_i1.p1  ORF type:complete len:432 (+),score=78.21 TRINITY_DN41317_c0_g1_i1:58-1296(+)